MQQQKTSHWLIAFRVIFTAALLACILFIFRNSMQTGEVSSARSQAVTTLVNGFLGKFGLGPCPSISSASWRISPSSCSKVSC